MTVEYLPVGVKCNLKCTYCYQEPMRDAGNFSVPLNFVRVKDSIIKSGGKFALFGGEPLLATMEHLETVLAFGTEIGNHNGLQTNGLLVNPDHVDLFKKHKVHVGVSIDGPGLCNSARSSDFDTELIISNIVGMLQEGISVSLIITVHALNAMHMRDLLFFIDDMEKAGVRFFNFHNLEVDNHLTDFTLKLSDTENFRAFATIYWHTKRKDIDCLPFKDIRSLLTVEKPYVSCIWSGCDPITTPAVQGINAEGSLTNCGRTNKLGIDWIKSNNYPSMERYQALAITPYAKGGCKDCEYFFACKGQCPGTAIDGDWRNRTKDCVFWYSLIDMIRGDLVDDGVPVLDLKEANQRFLRSIYAPPSRQQTQHSDTPHGDYHGDHTDFTSNASQPPK